MAIDYQRASELLLEKQQAMVCEESEQFHDALTTLLDALIGIVPWDWRYNATHWALDVGDLCNEIGFSIAWMRAFAEYWSDCDERDRRSAEGSVSYFADNAATRISSCRDKLALLAWSYYCPFNPDKKDEVLNFNQIRERLINPIRFGLRLEGHEEFLAALHKLTGSDFQTAAIYRNKKVHRMEPRVMLREPAAPDQSSYMFALVTEKETRKFDEKLECIYSDRSDEIREGCFIDGVLFDRRAPEQLLWHFEDFDQFTYACWKKLCDAAAGSYETLLAREPLLSKDNPSGGN